MRYLWRVLEALNVTLLLVFMGYVIWMAWGTL